MYEFFEDYIIGDIISLVALAFLVIYILVTQIKGKDKK